MIARLDEARCEVALMWEDRLMYVLPHVELQLSYDYIQSS